MCRSADNLILQFSAQIIEIIAVTGHTDNQVTVFLRMFLCITEHISGNNIELDMMTIQAEIPPDQLDELGDAFFSLKK